MKKSINIGLILFLLLQACSGPENSENQIINEPSPQDTSVNSSVKPGNPPPPSAGNNPPPPPAGNNPPPPPAGNNPPPPPAGNNPPPPPAGNNPPPPPAGNNPPPPPAGNNPPPPPAGNNPPPPPAGNNPDRDDEKNTGSWYDLSIYEYSPSYSVATSNGNTGFGLNEKGDILLSGYGFNNAGGATKLNHPVSISANSGKLAVTDRFNNRVLIWNTIPSSNTPPDLVLWTG